MRLLALVIFSLSLSVFASNPFKVYCHSYDSTEENWHSRTGKDKDHKRPSEKFSKSKKSDSFEYAEIQLNSLFTVVAHLEPNNQSPEKLVMKIMPVGEKIPLMTSSIPLVYQMSSGGRSLTNEESYPTFSFQDQHTIKCKITNQFAVIDGE